MNGKAVKRLYDMEIDEVSIVDRPANQHAAIVISKADEEGGGVSDEYVDIDDLDIGDVVVDDDGNEYEVVEDDSDYDDFGKAATDGLKGLARLKRARTNFTTGRYIGGMGGKEQAKAFGRSGQLGAHLQQNKGKYIAGTAAGLAGAGGLGAYYATKPAVSDEPYAKSLGDVFLEELSKAASEDDRNEIISKYADEVEIAKAAAAEAWEAVAQERDLRMTDEFIAKADSYNLPVAGGVLGPILKSMAEVLDDDQLEVVDQLFTAIGEDLYNELGYEGGGDNYSVLDEVEAHASELVGKSDFTGAEAIAGLFEANPEAYEQYLAEGR